jgi:hypothetical protein
MCAIKGKLAKLNYMEIKQLLDRKVIENKRGTLTNREIKLLVKKIHDHRRENELEHGTAEREIEAMRNKIQQYNVMQLGDIPTEREDGTMRILLCQMRGCASTETRGIKIVATE